MSEFEFGGTYSTTLSQFQGDPDIRQLAKQPGVYCIQSVDRQLYIGMSGHSMTERVNAHYSGHSNPYLYRRLLSAREYNETIILTLYPLDPVAARTRERALVYELDPVYNRRLR